MKFRRFVMLTGCAAWMTSALPGAEAPASSVPGPESEPGNPAAATPEKAPSKSLAELVRDLADPSFRTREEASRALWSAGESALSDLKKAAAAKDPEQAFRAREIIRKIQLFITPDTDPEVIKIVERYEKAGVDEKLDLFSQLRQKRAWRQMLKLYASETNSLLHSRIQAVGEIELVPVVAARECLKRGDTAGAREFLEMAPADAVGLLSLAEFHRAQGSLDEELKRAMTLEGKRGAAWRLALYRASGNIEAARDAAVEAEEPDLAALFSVYLGDPLPWLRREARGGGARSGSRTIYTDLAIKRWQGSSLRPSDLESLEKAVVSRDRNDRNGAIAALVLLGEYSSAEKSFARHNPLEAFSYFESLERTPEALAAIGLDPAKPDYENWVRERMEKLTESPDFEEDDVMSGSHEMELITLARFLERRGLHEISAAAFTEPLEKLASKDEEMFIGLISRLLQVDGIRLGAPTFARKFLSTWAGQDEDRWELALSEIFSDSEEIVSLWDWFGYLDPAASLPDRLEGLLALRGMAPDPRKLAEHWKTLAFASVEALPEDKRQPFLVHLTRLTPLENGSTDAAGSLRMWTLLPEETRSQYYWQASHAMDLSAAGRWEEMAAFCGTIIDRLAKMNLEPQPEWHASLAGSLRQAGKLGEASREDARVESFALGRDSIEIGVSYAYCQDYKRANEWWSRALLRVSPGSRQFAGALVGGENLMMDQGRWREAAAISEVRAHNLINSDLATAPDEGLMLLGRSLRFNSDLARALANLQDDRAGSIEMLANCHRKYPNDSGIADNFFPALRRVGLLKEHDAWFNETWKGITAVLDEFPEAENTGNSAAWIASRARRNLDEAEAILEKSLAANPTQSSYLDTMGEIHFARGDRKKAMEWSSQAVNFEPTSEMLRRQHERFRSGPFPK